jgi:hypothetical protein
MTWSRDSSVGIATGWTVGAQFPARERDYSLLHSVQTGSGVHPASYPMDTGALYPGVKPPVHEADHSLPFVAEVENGGAIPPLPHTSSWHGV